MACFPVQLAIRALVILLLTSARQYAMPAWPPFTRFEVKAEGVERKGGRGREGRRGEKNRIKHHDRWLLHSHNREDLQEETNRVNKYY